MGINMGGSPSSSSFFCCWMTLGHWGMGEQGETGGLGTGKENCLSVRVNNNGLKWQEGGRLELGGYGE